MKLHATLPALFLGTAVALAIPTSADAEHRHSRSCGHYGGGHSHYRPARPSYGYGVGLYYRAPPPAYGYGYGYRPYYAAPYRPYTPYYRPYYAPRPRVHISFGFGW
jgi:hypothetical protein